MQPTDRSQISVKTSEDHGVVVYIADWALADDFEDFLASEEYVKYDMTSDETGGGRTTGFWFGVVADLQKVEQLVERYLDTAARNNS
ncbi:MAG: hypothetical protein GXX91_12600 [Verrucomicrobiaceae bacterium]|nr:hypothetical protein [Verrucomicrobiaceae bacterium]